MAEMVGQKIREGTVLCLEGDLGVGKTLFVQSLAHTLGVEGEVTSPTFNLMNVYEGICPIYHFDLYRLETEEELEDIGFYEYTEDPEGIVVGQVSAVHAGGSCRGPHREVGRCGWTPHHLREYRRALSGIHKGVGVICLS